MAVWVCLIQDNLNLVEQLALAFYTRCVYDARGRTAVLVVVVV